MDLGLPDESGGIVGAQAFVGIPKYYMIVKYDLKGYDYHAGLKDKQKALMGASMET